MLQSRNVFILLGCRGHNGGVQSLQTSGSRVFSCGADSCIKAWDLDDLVRGCKSTVVAHSQKVSWKSVPEPVLLSVKVKVKVRI